MAKLKGAALLRKQKDAKQKKLLLVLIPVFVLLLVWQGPSYLKMLKGDTAATPTETSPSTETLPDGTPPDPSTAPPPSTSVPGGTEPGVPTDGSTSLPDSDQPAPADSGQLVSFERFVGKDPFKQLVDTSPTVSEPTVSPVPSPTPGGTGGTPPPDDGGSDDDLEPVAAVIKVNGEKETVSLDGKFPKDEELFVLKKLTRTSAWIGLVSGEFSNGKDAIEVEVGDTLNLVSQPDGIRYTIKVLRVSVA